MLISHKSHNQNQNVLKEGPNYFVLFYTYRALSFKTEDRFCMMNKGTTETITNN